MPQCHNTYSKSTQYCTITITNWPFAEKPFVYWQKSPLHTPKKPQRTLRKHTQRTHVGLDRFPASLESGLVKLTNGSVRVRKKNEKKLTPSKMDFLS